MDTAKQRDHMLAIVNAQPDKWFDVSYRLRAHVNGDLEFDSLQVIPASLVDSFYDMLTEEDKILVRADLAMYGTYYIKAQGDGTMKRVEPTEIYNTPKTTQSDNQS